MKIYILPVLPKFQPDRQNFTAPAHNDPTLGVEDDFSHWLSRQPDLTTDDPKRADWNYLDIRWNKLDWNWKEAGYGPIQAEIDRLVSRSRPTFTICEYDLAGLRPIFDLRGMRVFTASRRSASPDLVDIPLLCSPHVLRSQPAKRWLACFNGNIETDGIRIDMAAEPAGQTDVWVGGQWMDSPQYAELIAASHVALAPRGQGAQSFRFYEAMQLGTVPLQIGEPDPRPFKRWLPWDECSLWRPGVEGLNEFLDGLDQWQLMEMGRRAAQGYPGHLAYGQW